MKKDKIKTKVTFFVEKEYNDEYLGDNVLAVFIDTVCNRKHFLECYARIGQHSECHIDYLIKNCRLATKEEYKDLFEELECNYNVDAIQEPLNY